MLISFFLMRYYNISPQLLDLIHKNSFFRVMEIIFKKKEKKIKTLKQICIKEDVEVHFPYNLLRYNR